MKLKRKIVPKPWGQDLLPKIFGGKQKDKIGEIWFEPPKGITPSLMVKYLFTSEKLSIQVHPNDRLARRVGFPHGKDECWYVLEAEPGAVMGIGLTKDVSSTKLRTACLLGEIENLIDWKPVKSGDFFNVPAGTIHAIGPGIKLVEVQQNVDITYRLYDYGRSRELHLDEGLVVAKTGPYDIKHYQAVSPDHLGLILDGPHFRIFQILSDEPQAFANTQASEWQIIPLEGQVTVRGELIKEGECGICPRLSDIDLSKNIRSLIACNMK